jgi:hypothetical protein
MPISASKRPSPRCGPGVGRGAMTCFVVASLLAVVSCSSASKNDGAPATANATVASDAATTPPGPAPAVSQSGTSVLGTGSPSTSGDDVSTLARLGIGVYSDAGSARPEDAITGGTSPSPIRLLDTQAHAMLVEVVDGQGLLGATFDGMIGTDPGMPPASFLVAGWVTGSTSPRAAYALQLMGARRWTNAPAVVFPNLVLALYAADAAEFASSLTDPVTTGTSTGSAPATASHDTTVATPTASAGSASAVGASGFRVLDRDRAGLSRRRVAGLCSQVQGFVNGTVTALFDAIGHLAQPAPPASSNGPVGWFVAGLTAGYGLAVGAVNGLIDVTHFLVQKLIGLVTQPVLGYIARIAGVLGTVSLVVSFLRPWTIRMADTPPATRKAIGAEPGLAGTVTATVDLGGFDEWPPDIVDCALNAGVTLPPLKPVGAPIVWTMTQSDALADAATGNPTVLDANGSAAYSYATTQESVETSKGDPASGVMNVHASIRRPGVAEAQQAIANLTFSQIPDLIRPILQPLLQPTLTFVLNKIASYLDSTADTQVLVSYHSPPATTTTSTPETTIAAVAGPIDPCSLVTAQDATAAMGSALPAGVSTPTPWGGQCEIVGGFILLDLLIGPAYKGGQAGYNEYLADAQNGKANDTTGKSILEIVGGIGEGAYVNAGGPLAVCVFYFGNTTVGITVRTGGNAGPPPIAQVTAIARTAAARLVK